MSTDGSPRPAWKMRMVAWLSRQLGDETEVAGPARARESMRRTTPEFIFGPKTPVHAVRDSEVAGVRVRRYVPHEAKDGVTVYFHGGGWMVGDLDSHDHIARALAAASKHEVISVDYRRTPEHRYPAGRDDCLAVTQALAATHHAVVVAGDSAGGNLAAVVAQRFAREQRPLRGQLLVYPVTDCADETPSYSEFANALLSRETMRYYRREYVPEVTLRATSDVSPLRADTLDRVAPAYVLLARCDVLYDEGVAYAEKLRTWGTPVELDVLPTMMHGFFNLLGLEESRAAMSRAATWVASRLSD